MPPILAVEAAGQDEEEQVLRDKARWYLDRGVATVWLVLPEPRTVLVLRPDFENRLAANERFRADPALVGLTPAVAELFAQLDR